MQVLFRLDANAKLLSPRDSVDSFGEGEGGNIIVGWMWYPVECFYGRPVNCARALYGPRAGSPRAPHGPYMDYLSRLLTTPLRLVPTRSQSQHDHSTDCFIRHLILFHLAIH